MIDLVPVNEAGFVEFGDLDAWLAAREAEAVSMLGDAAEKIATTHVSAYMETLTADASTLDGMGAEWRAVLDLFVEEAVGSTFLAGAAQSLASLGVAAIQSSVDVDRWLEVVNDRAVTYQKTATNRLVGIGDEMWADVRRSTVESLKAGVEIPKLRREVERVAGVARSRATAIARTETLGAYNGGDWEGAVALGDAGPVEKAWLATLDARTREDHAAADGQTVPFGEPFSVGGVEMMRPLDPAGPPSEVVNCRCVMQMFFEGDVRPDGSVVEPA